MCSASCWACATASEGAGGRVESAGIGVPRIHSGNVFFYSIDYSMQAKAVLVTGAARRIGATIARTLHAAGANVALHCHRSRDEAGRVAAELNAARPRSCVVVQADLLDLASLPRLVDEAAAAFGGLDGL